MKNKIKTDKDLGNYLLKTATKGCAGLILATGGAYFLGKDISSIPSIQYTILTGGSTIAGGLMVIRSIMDLCGLSDYLFWEEKGKEYKEKKE